MLGAAVAGVFGIGVSKHMSPYGANDPATQSVQAMNRFQAAAGRQIDPGIVALVAPATCTARPRGPRPQVEATLRVRARRRRRRSYYDTHDPAMVSRDGRSTYVVAYFKPLSDTRLKDDAQTIVNQFASQHDVKLGGDAVANAQANTQVGNDLARAELLAFPFIFLLSLLFFRSLVASLLPPLLGGLAILMTFLALRIVSSFADLSVFALNLVDRPRARARDRLQPVHGLPLPRGGGASTASARTRSAARSQTSGRTILYSSLTVAAAVASLTIFPQRFLYSMGIAGALVTLIAAALALVVLPALLSVLGPRVNALAPKRLQRAADRDARPAESGFWYRLSQFVMRRPGRIAIAAAATLIALGIPFASIKFLPGQRERAADERQRAPGRRRAADRSSRRVARPARGGRRRARRLAAGGRVRRAAPRAAGRLRGRAGASRPARTCRWSTSRRSHRRTARRRQHLVHVIRALRTPVLPRRRRARRPASSTSSTASAPTCRSCCWRSSSSRRWSSCS